MKSYFNKIRRKFFRFLPLLAVLLYGQGLIAQEKSLRASAPSVVKAGTAFNYVVMAEEQGQVKISPPDGIRILGGPSQMISYQSSNVNGRLENVTQISYTWALMPEKTGEFTIPPAEMKAGRKEYISNEVRLTVAEETASSGQTGEPEGVMLQLIPSRRTIYEGEQLVVEMKVLVRERLQLTSMPSRAYEGFWVENLEGDNFARDEVVDGYQYKTQVIARDLLTAQKKGEILVGPFQMDVNIQKVVKRKRSGGLDDFFDDPFFDSPFQSYENVARSIKSNSLKIEVRPLPPGAPAGFSGAVGNLKVKAELTKDSLNVNEALTLKITLSGKGNLGLISAPVMDFPPDLEVFEPEKKSDLRHEPGGTSGSVSFEYSLIPRFGGTYRIAPLDFSFFNPATGKYDRFISKEFSFNVKGDKKGSEQETGMQSGFFREDVRNLNRDIQFIKLDNKGFYRKNVFMVRKAWFNIVYLAGILSLLLLYFYRRKRLSREADIFYVRNKRAWKLAAGRLKKAKQYLQAGDDRIYEEILRAVNGYLADRLGMQTSDLSWDKIEGKLQEKSLEGDIIAGLRKLLDECELARYAPSGSVEMKKQYEDAVRCLGNIESKI